MEIHFLGQPDRDPFVSADWDADPDWQFRVSAELGPEQLRQRYREACDRSRAVVRQASGLEQLSVKPVRGKHFSLRWVLLHLIEEPMPVTPTCCARRSTVASVSTACFASGMVARTRAAADPLRVPRACGLSPIGRRCSS